MVQEGKPHLQQKLCKEITDKTTKKIEEINQQIKVLKDKLSKKHKQFEKQRNSKIILFLSNRPIDRDLVNDIYDEYKGLIDKKVKKLDVIIHSSGGDLDATYHLVSLFRKMTFGELTFMVPRWAKSAATCLVCGGDSLVMGETSEIGPVDPQVTIINRGKKEETFSPLSIKTMLKLLGDLYNEGHKEFIKEISKEIRPLTLGEHIHSLEVSPTYLHKILKSRMLKDAKDEDIKKIAEILGQGYPHHGFCILADDVEKLGLNVKRLSKTQWAMLWDLWKIYDQISDLDYKKIMLIQKTDVLRELLDKGFDGFDEGIFITK